MPVIQLTLSILFLAAMSASTVLAEPQATKTADDAGRISFIIVLAEKNCQVAVWLTDSQGRFIDTVHVSRKTGQMGLGNRGGGLDDRLGGSRLSLLPVWAHQRGINYGGGNFYPPAEKPLPDAVSSATAPAGRFNLNWKVPDDLPAAEYVYYVEVNKSFDDNEHHDYSWYRGQPSVVWRGTLTVGQGASQSQAQIIGHGHPAGADGSINRDLSTLTTALQLIESVAAASSR